jgi:hypothetical protein
MNKFRFSTYIGMLGIFIGLCAFSFNYHMTTLSFPGYTLFMAPAIFSLSFFSEETAFSPKMILFISGQFLGYFCLAYIFSTISIAVKNKS